MKPRWPCEEESRPALAQALMGSQHDSGSSRGWMMSDHLRGELGSVASRDNPAVVSDSPAAGPPTLHRTGSHAQMIRPEDAGWSSAGLRIVTLAAAVPVTIDTADSEAFVLPLSGSVRVEVAGAEVFQLAGRDSVFTQVSDFA